MMSHRTPHIDNWEFSATEPWEVLSSLLESCCSSPEEEEEAADPLQSSGAALGLEFLVLVCRLDLENYLAQSIAHNRLAADYRPLLANILSPSDSLAWGGRMKQLCKLFSRAVAEKVPALPTVRCLVALTAQLLQLKERTGDSNTQKVEMAKFLATELQLLGLGETQLWAQLYLLEPAWLSALVSREMLSLATNIQLQPVSLRSIMDHFVEASPSLDSAEGKSELKQPLTVQALNNNENESESETKPATKPAKSSKSGFPAKTKTIDVSVDLVKIKMTEEMRQQLRPAPSASQEKPKHVRVDLVKPSKPSNKVIPRNCGPLIELSITKYIASNGLASIYKTFKAAKLEDLLSGVNNGKVELEDQSVDKIKFPGGFKKFQFGVRPRFDLYRSEKTKVQDLRDYEQLINKKDLAEESPISTLLYNLNISK